MQSFSPTKIVSFELVTGLVLSKEPLGGTSPSIQAGELYSPLINMLNIFSYIYIYIYLERSVSLPSFSHFAKVSSPFLQRAVCSFTESSKKSEEQEEGVLPQGADTGFFFSFLLYFSRLTFLPWFFPHF